MSVALEILDIEVLDAFAKMVCFFCSGICFLFIVVTGYCELCFSVKIVL